MRSNRNHEGYHDPTACEAVRRAESCQKEKVRGKPLFYKLGDLRGLQEASRGIHRG